MFVTLSVLRQCSFMASPFATARRRTASRAGGVIQNCSLFPNSTRSPPSVRTGKSIAPILLRRGICIQPRRGRHVSGEDISTGHRAHCSNDPRARSAMFPEDPCVVTKRTRLATTPAARSVSTVVASRIVFTAVCNRSTRVYRDVLPEGFWGVVALFVVSATKCRRNS
ncbi:unnamed protein product [Ixodes pacificus]